MRPRIRKLSHFRDLPTHFFFPSRKVYEFMTSVMTSLQGRAHGEDFVDEDPAAVRPLGFMQVRPYTAETPGPVCPTQNQVTINITVL